MSVFGDDNPEEQKIQSRLRKLKMPQKQRSEMTDEEQLANPEEGAHEQGYLETAEDALTQGKDQLGPDVKSGAVGIGRIESAAEGAAGKLEKGMSSLSKARSEEGPLFHEAVAASRERGLSPPKFHEHIQMEPPTGSVSKLEMPAANNERSLQAGRFETGNPAVKGLQEERQRLNLNTPEGRSRLKEIDGLLKNRTYFKE